MKCSVRFLLTLQVAVAAVLAIYLMMVADLADARRRAAAVQSFRSSGFHIVFNVPHVTGRSANEDPWASSWYGQDGVALVELVRFKGSASATASAAAFQGVRDLAEVRKVILAEAAWLTDDDLQLLSRCRELQTLDLSGTNVTSRGIEPVAELPALWSLLLKENTGIDDTCVPILGRMKQLRLLDIRGTHISDDGIAKLNSSLSECFIRVDE